MNKFIDTERCLSGAWCRWCRDLEAGRPARKYIVATHVAPAASPGKPSADFECPPERGAKPWGFVKVTVRRRPPRLTAEEKAARKFRPGNVVGVVLKTMGYQQHCGCGCAEFKRRMNELGWIRCLTVNRQEIIAWFVARAIEQNIQVTSGSVWGLIKAGAKDVLKRRFLKK